MLIPVEKSLLCLPTVVDLSVLFSIPQKLNARLIKAGCGENVDLTHNAFESSLPHVFKTELALRNFHCVLGKPYLKNLT